jgi:hypothetical protein
MDDLSVDELLIAIESTKKCKGCCKVLPLSDFPLTRVGWNKEELRKIPMNYCNACKNERQRISYQKHKEKRCQNRRDDYDRQRQTGQSQASLIVVRAIELGLFERPSFCEACGERSSNIHGHHEDYSKPLEVQWLCSKCHREEHTANGGFAKHKGDMMCDGLDKLRKELKAIDERYKDSTTNKHQKDLLRQKQKEGKND